MNRCWKTPLVTATRGGRAQGACLPKEGRLVLNAFRALERRLSDVTRDDPAYATLVDNLRDARLPTAAP